MAYTTADDWLARFEAARCRMKIDPVTMNQAEGQGASDACLMLWSELQGASNKTKWDEVLKEVRLRLGPIIGWAYYPR
jgi:hypothetical protein